MNVSEYMKKHALTDDDLNAMAAPYEVYREALDYYLAAQG